MQCRGTFRTSAWVLTTLASVFVSVLTGCGGGGGGSSPSAPSQVSTPDYSGSWRGTTGNVDQTTGRPNPIVFSVQGQSIPTLTVHIDLNSPPDSVSLPPGRTTRGFCTYVFTNTGPGTITGNTFRVPIGSTSPGFAYATTVTGTFSSTTSAQGAIATIPVAAISCQGTVAFYSPPASDWQPNWTATRD